MLAMLFRVYLFAAAVLTTAADISTDVPNQCPQPFLLSPDPPAYFYGHPKDCRYFFTCAHGRPTMLTCGPASVWNNDIHTCVGLMSHYDTCSFTQGNVPHISHPQCSTGDDLVPHPSACQRYFNCSDTSPRANRNMNRYESECPYPQLFDSREMKCRNYGDAYCGPGRIAAKDPCEYTMNLCGSAHCEPCGSRLPSCVGRSDGKYDHPSKPGSPYQMVCFSERLVSIQNCRNTATSLNDQTSETKKDCYSMWEMSG